MCSEQGHTGLCKAFILVSASTCSQYELHHMFPRPKLANLSHFAASKFCVATRIVGAWRVPRFNGPQFGDRWRRGVGGSDPLFRRPLRPTPSRRFAASSRSCFLRQVLFLVNTCAKARRNNGTIVVSLPAPFERPIGLAMLGLSLEKESTWRGTTPRPR